MEPEVLLVSPEQIREMDRAAIEDVGIPGIVLMERAALGACVVLQGRWPEARRVAVFCGPGNNGGDGLAMARILAERGIDVEVVLAAAPDTYEGDAQTNLHICARLGMAFVVLVESPEALENITADVFVDALLGTGIDRMVTQDSVVGTCISHINSAGVPTLAVDVPSGVHGRTGQVAGLAVRAQATATFGLPKLGLALTPGRTLAGDITVVDIGLPYTVVDNVGWEAIWLTPQMLPLGRRPATLHKGQAGRVCVVGGSPGFAGAIALTASASLARGAGLVTAITSESGARTVLALRPEVMTAELSDHARVAELIRGADVVAAGPGLGRSAEAEAALYTAWGQASVMVADADALFHLMHHFDTWSERGRPSELILTPHPGEAAAILGRAITEVTLDPVGAAFELATRFDAVVVVKGASTVVASHDGRLAVNRTGNPGMATAGMGDVLTGIIAATLCETDDAFEGVCHAVCLHGHAGDVAARTFGQRGITAGAVVSAVERLWPELEIA